MAGIASIPLIMLLAGAPLSADMPDKHAPVPVVRLLHANIHNPDMHIAMQVRIEQRIVIRVPRRTSSRVRLLSTPLPETETGRFKARKIGKCVAMKDVAGVQLWTDDTLVLYMSDSRMIRAELEKTCRAQDFYQGFYMVKSGDGKLCADRDVLQARSGSKCEVEDIRQLDPIKTKK